MHSSPLPLILFLMIAPAVFSQENDVLTNTISKESSAATAQATSNSASQATAGAQNPPGPVPHPPGPVAPPHPGIPPPMFPGVGAGAGAGFHKSIDFSAGAGAGLGPLLAGLLPGYGMGVPQSPPIGVPLPPPVGDVPDIPPPVDSLLGGGPGYLGFPGFLGPTYVPYSWLGSALGAKGDLLFPIVIFVFVIVGIWTVVQFLLALIVPLIAGKLAVGKGLLAAKTGKFLRSVDPMEEHHEEINNLTHEVHSAIDAHEKEHTDPTPHRTLSSNQKKPLHSSKTNIELNPPGQLPQTTKNESTEKKMFGIF